MAPTSSNTGSNGRKIKTIARIREATADASQTQVTPSLTRSLAPRAAEFLAYTDGARPVWVRAPKNGLEFHTGSSRSKMYEWASKGYIRSVSIREPGQIKGCRLFHLGSILEFIAGCEESEGGAHE